MRRRESERESTPTAEGKETERKEPGAVFNLLQISSIKNKKLVNYNLVYI